MAHTNYEATTLPTSINRDPEFHRLLIGWVESSFNTGDTHAALADLIAHVDARVARADVGGLAAEKIVAIETIGREDSAVQAFLNLKRHNQLKWGDVLAQMVLHLALEKKHLTARLVDAMAMRACANCLVKPALAPQKAEQTFAWAAFSGNGNVIIWSRQRGVVEPVAAKYGKPVVPVTVLHAEIAHENNDQESPDHG